MIDAPQVRPTSATAPTAHVDTFVLDALPPPEAQPTFLFTLPALQQFPERLNCAAALLDRWIEAGAGDRPCLHGAAGTWSYAEAQRRSHRIARVLVEDLGLVPGQRVLLHAPNSPMMAACWLAVVLAGGICVATMPLLRAKELAQVIRKARISHALCDARVAEALDGARPDCPTLQHVLHFNTPDHGGLAAHADAKPAGFTCVDTAATDPCLVAFTSGTTGQPKGTVHTHRDVMAACLCWPPHVLRPQPDDVFIGSPPLAFTFGLGGLLLFPLHAGASTVLLERATPDALLDAVAAHRATILFTAPTSYRALAPKARDARIGAPHGGPLRKCVSAGEVLPAATRQAWKEATGLEMIDGIGSTELLHIFISADEAHARAGATGLAVPGYVAEIHDEHGRPVPPGTVGRLAVKGPTGCRYLDDPRQSAYVHDGWNYTGDAYLQDADGYFHFQSRTDDLIVSAGYNIAAIDVEDALLRHPAVAECGVIGVPDAARGQIVKAFVVLKPGEAASEEQARALQDHVKQAIAPYKYPRALSFVEQLPRTATGKLQRFRLRDLG